MKKMIFKKKNTVRVVVLLLSLMVASILLLSAVPVFADTGLEGEHGKPLEDVLQEIRDKQGLGPDEAIDPRKVSDGKLEELGEAVISIMHPDSRQHELMDQMMGGEGSESLKSAHKSMGYNYLAGQSYGKYGMFGRRGMMGGMMGGGMMGRGMISGYGRNQMMFLPFGGLIMWLLILIIIGVVVYLIVRTQRGVSRRNYIASREETPIEIAKKRYAQGKITKEEYETIKQNL
ncbi:hypothetical protein ES705_24242 [subsurface metagenome]